MLTNVLTLTGVLAAALIVMRPKIARSTMWRAAITPLASIIGSGFLILGPVLNASYGGFAPLVMLGLCAVAYLFGAAIRFNIAQIDNQQKGLVVCRGRFQQKLEIMASWALAFAYIISVAYYLSLFGAFGVSLTSVNDAAHAKILTSAMLILILIIGSSRGFGALERTEQVFVSIKLSVIAGLLVGLGAFFLNKAGHSELVFNPATQTGWPGLTLAFGLIITVQGFETSRYLGAQYDAQTRIRSMQFAQWLSTAIYMIYILLIAYVFKEGTLQLHETQIINMMAIVAPILPVLLVAAGLSAQFSAAIADTGGAGGLFSELTRNRIKPTQGYELLVVIALLLIWSANIFEIINLASRAFAVYYSLQASIAAIGAWQSKDNKLLAVGFFGMALLAALIVIFGTPAQH